MKIKLLQKLSLFLVGAALMFGFSAALAQSAGRKVEKSFFEEMKIVDASYASNIKQDKSGAYYDYNKVGLAEIAKKKYENQKIEFTKTQLSIPTSEDGRRVVLEGYPQRISYLQAEILKMKNSVDIYNAKRELTRMQTIVNIVKNSNSNKNEK